MAEIQVNGVWHVVMFDMVSGPPPSGWREQSWEYDEARFAAIRASGHAMHQWLTGGIPVIAGIRGALPEIHDSVLVERHQSKSQSAYDALDWPVVQYSLNLNQTQRGSGIGALIGDDAPSFFQFQAAAAAFFGVELTGRNMENGPWLLRRQDTSGRITRISLRPATGLTAVTVEAPDFGDMAIELASDHPGVSRSLSSYPAPEQGKFQEIAVEFDGALHRNAWVLLKRHRNWVDRRFLNWGYRTTPDEGIEEIVERQAQLETLVSLGEGPNIEFKVELPTRQAGGEPLNFLRTVAAFANGQGGTILFGVTDDGDAIGLLRTEVEGRTRDRITELVRSTVTPLPSYSIDLFDVEGQSDRVVIGLRVEAGDEPPYGIKPGNPSYYVRRGATTFPASSQEVRYLARSRPPATQNTLVPWASA